MNGGLEGRINKHHALQGLRVPSRFEIPKFWRLEWEGFALPVKALPFPVCQPVRAAAFCGAPLKG